MSCQCRPVLIETLWNVNDETHKDYTGLHVVLIETLWNVNGFSGRYYWIDNWVLIETLWNVNILLQRYNRTCRSINRNIVECKSSG